MPFANLEVVEVVCGRDLHRARALLGVGVVVTDDGDGAIRQWQHDALADEVLVLRLLVRRVHGHRRIAEHGLGARGGDRDVGRRIVRIVGRAFERVVEIVHVPRRLFHEQLGETLVVESNRVALLVLVAAGPLERARFLGRLDLEVGDDTLELRVPVDEALVLVDQALIVKIDEDLGDGLHHLVVGGPPLAHGEALAAPVAGGA